ncbi:MAG TPA: S8 family serine peptidase [bacterium]|nr:S8 family serine peptidase [bacterium]
MKLVIFAILFFSLNINANETVFVKFDNDIKKFSAIEFSDCGINDYYKIPRTSYYAVKTENSAKAVRCISQNRSVKKVFADEPMNISYKKAVPDPYLQNQWHFQNTGQTGIAGNDAKVIEAWNYLEELGIKPGLGVKIGLIDDAFDLHHPDMEGKFLKGRDVTNGSDYPYAHDNEPHGTCVAGVIAAVKDNGIGVAGACPFCRIVPVRASEELGKAENMANAFNYLLDRGVHVISNSWGPSDNSGPVEMPEIIAEIINFARFEFRKGKGIVVFFAAGNGNESISDPETFDGFAASPDVIAVGAVNASGSRSAYSDFGEDLDIVSPSSDVDAGYIWDPFAIDLTSDGIWTVDARWYYGYNQTDYTSTFGGTSSATPLVAAVAGLMISAYPDVTWDEIYEIITESADKIAPADAGYDENGFSIYYGYGRINAVNALKMLCGKYECAGGLEESEEEVYESYDQEIPDEGEFSEFPDDSMLPIEKYAYGCNITLF